MAINTNTKINTATRTDQRQTKEVKEIYLVGGYYAPEIFTGEEETITPFDFKGENVGIYKVREALKHPILSGFKDWLEENSEHIIDKTEKFYNTDDTDKITLTVEDLTDVELARAICMYTGSDPIGGFILCGSLEDAKEAYKDEEEKADCCYSNYRYYCDRYDNDFGFDREVWMPHEEVERKERELEKLREECK